MIISVGDFRFWNSRNLGEIPGADGGGMGWGAYEAMRGYGIWPIVTDMADIDKAVELYLAGRLLNLMGRLH